MPRSSRSARSVSFGLDYSRALPNDFSLVAGANIIRSSDDSDDGGENSDEERVYVGISRSFTFLP